MADELKLHKDMDRAARAKALIEDETLNEAFNVLETQYIDYWRNSTPLPDVAARERLWQAVHILGTVRAHLKTVVNNGKVAEAELRDLAQGRRS